MDTIIQIVVLCAVAVFGGVKKAPPNRHYCEVVRVVDGDTVRVKINGIPDTLRLLYINTPERGQPGYSEATNALREMLAGKKAYIELPEGNARGAYNRLLVYLYADDVLINTELIKKNHSAYWQKYGISKKYHKIFTAANIKKAP